MDNIQSAGSVTEALAEERQKLHDQLLAAWQKQVYLGWRDHVERIFEERFAEMASALEAEHSKSVATAGRDLASRLNLAVRRLRQYETEEQFVGALLDAAEGFAHRLSFFSVTGATLVFRGARSLEDAVVIPAEIPLDSAPAFQSAVESLDTIVAMPTQAELSEAVAAAFETADRRNAYLFPIVNRGRAVAVVCADSGENHANVSALELLAAVAGAVLESRPVLLAGAVEIAPVPEPKALSARDQRAKGFARRWVAEMLLYGATAVKAGRATRDLYGALAKPIEDGREAFRREFLHHPPGTADYFHFELLQTLARGNAVLLGPRYPGPMV